MNIYKSDYIYKGDYIRLIAGHSPNRATRNNTHTPKTHTDARTRKETQTAGWSPAGSRARSTDRGSLPSSAHFRCGDAADNEMEHRWKHTGFPRTGSLSSSAGRWEKREMEKKD